MIKISKETTRKMKDVAMEMGYGWDVLYRDNERLREQKATDTVNKIISLFCNEMTREDEVKDD